VIGLFKKVVIADWWRCRRATSSASSPAAPSPASATPGSRRCPISFQIYFDFSAYSDMAIGLGRMFGLEIPINFASPTRRDRSSILAPLATSPCALPARLSLRLARRAAARAAAPAVNLMLTMLLGGLWHGAGWTFIAWGGLHGLYLWMNHAWRATPSPRGLPRSGYWAIVAHGITFLAVVIAWGAVRAPILPLRHGCGPHGGLNAWHGPRIEPAAGYGGCRRPGRDIAGLLPNAMEFMARAGIGTPSRSYPRRSIAPPLTWRGRRRWAWRSRSWRFALCLLKLNDVSNPLFPLLERSAS